MRPDVVAVKIRKNFLLTQREEMITEGIKANDYNACYEKTMFDVISRGELYEIREINTGLTFFIEKGAFSDKGRSEGRTASIKGNVEGHKGY